MEDKKILEYLEREKKLNNKDLLLIVKRRVRFNNISSMIMFSSILIMFFGNSMDIVNKAIEMEKVIHPLNKLQTALILGYISFLSDLFNFLFIILMLILIWKVSEYFFNKNYKKEKEIIKRIKNG